MHTILIIALVSIPKLVEYTDGTISLLVPKGWEVEVATQESAKESPSVTVVPPESVIEDRGLVMISVTIEKTIDDVRTDMAMFVTKPKWSKAKGRWTCAVGFDPLDGKIAGALCGRKMDDTHWLRVQAFGAASKASLLALVKKMAVSTKGFEVAPD